MPRRKKRPNRDTSLLMTEDKMRTLRLTTPVYRRQEAADLIGVSKETLVRWEKNGVIKPYRLITGGHRRYTAQQIIDLRKTMYTQDYDPEEYDSDVVE